jgi:hypothetical protein
VAVLQKAAKTKAECFEGSVQIKQIYLNSRILVHQLLKQVTDELCYYVLFMYDETHQNTNTSNCQYSMASHIGSVLELHYAEVWRGRT